MTRGLPQSIVRRWRCLGLLLVGLGCGAAQARDALLKVDTALVLLVDVSSSVDAARYAIQRDGIAAAFSSPEVASAIAAGPNRAVAVALLEFSDPDRVSAAIGWTRVASDSDARRLSRRIAGLRRSSDGLTDIGDALLEARATMIRLPWPASRRLIDVSGDGMSNVGTPLEDARKAVLDDGITINGLPILGDEPAVETYYRLYLIGGPGAFEIPARGIGSFAAAIRRKLARELLMSSASAEPR